MFKSLLISWLVKLNEQFITAVDTNLLNVEISALDSNLYEYIKTILSSVAMPVAYVLLSFFAIMELYRASQRLDGAGGGIQLGAEVIFKVMIRVCVFKVVVDQSLRVMETIYGVGKTLIAGVQNTLAVGQLHGVIDIDALTAEINAMNLGEQFGMFIELSFVKLLVWIILLFVKVICISRLIQIYIYVAIAPVPLATLPSDEIGQIGKNFLKSFAALCVQGAILYLILTFFPVLVNSGVMGDGAGFWGIVLYSLVLATGVFTSGRVAKSICNAM